jgi:acyl-coenzyme A synthetase/AMP-(fatty) acid ligase
MAPTSIKAEDHGPPTQDYTGSLWDLLRKSAEQHRQNTALACCKQAAGHLSFLVPQDSVGTRSTSHLEWTYTQLLKASETLGLSLKAAGLVPGSTLVVFCPNNAEWTLLLWACASIGVTFAPLNPGFIDRYKEMRHVLETLQPAGIAVFDQGDALKLGEKYPELLDTRLKLVLSTEPEAAPTGWLTLPDIVNNSSTQNGIETSNTPRDTPELILFTSGTTSMPKACPHTGKSLEAQSRPYWETRRIGPSSRVLPIGPGVSLAKAQQHIHDDN